MVAFISIKNYIDQRLVVFEDNDKWKQNQIIFRTAGDDARLNVTNDAWPGINTPPYIPNANEKTKHIECTGSYGDLGYGPGF